MQKILKLILLVSSIIPMQISAEEPKNDSCIDELCITEGTHEDLFRKKIKCLKCLKVCGTLQVCGDATLSTLNVGGGPVIGAQYAYFYNDVPFGVNAGAEIPLGEQLFGLGITKQDDEYATVSLPGLYEVYFNLFSTTDNEMVTVLVNDVPAAGAVFKSSGAASKWSTVGVAWISLKPGDWTSFKTTDSIAAGTFAFSIKRIAPFANQMND